MNATSESVKRAFGWLAWIAALSLLIASCAPATPVTAEPPTVAPTEPPTAPPTEPPALPQKPLSGLSADPQRVEFQAADGKNLVGYYYPSKYADAPIVILMHWAGGDLCDW